MKKLLLIAAAVLLTGCSFTQNVVKIEHAVVAQYMCSQFGSPLKEFMVTKYAISDSYEITAWCENAVTITVTIPEAKPIMKDA